MNFIEQIILVIITNFLTYFLTRHQYKKDSLQEYKTKACKDLWDNLVDFVNESYPTNSIEKIFETYNKFQSSFLKSYAFLPQTLTYKIRSIDTTICYKLKSLNIPQITLDEFYGVNKTQHTEEFLLRNPNINSAFLNIFSSLTDELSNIAEEIEKELGIKSSKAKK